MTLHSNMEKSDAELAAPHFQHPQPQSQSNPAYGQVYSDNPNQADLMQQIQNLTTRIQQLEVNRATRINLNTDIIGLFETVTVAPTLIPTSPYEQVKLAVISGTYYIYAYNTSSKTWKRVAIT